MERAGRSGWTQRSAVLGDTVQTEGYPLWRDKVDRLLSAVERRVQPYHPRVGIGGSRAQTSSLHFVVLLMSPGPGGHEQDVVLRLVTT